VTVATGLTVFAYRKFYPISAIAKKPPKKLEVLLDAGVLL
jgi:hypothetical protein